MTRTSSALRKAMRQLSLAYDYGLIGEVYFEIVEELDRELNFWKG